MKNRFLPGLGLFAVALFCFLFSNVSAQEALVDSEKTAPAVTYGAEMDVNSRYVWHGIVLSQGAVAQPSAWVSAYGLKFSVWSNLVLEDEVNRRQFNEVDVVCGYGLEFGKLSFEPSFALYLYPNQPDAPSTGELALKVSYALGALRVFTNHSSTEIGDGG